MKWWLLAFALLLAGAITAVGARLRNDPDWFGTSLTPGEVGALMAEAAPAFDEAMASGRVRGVSVHCVWEGWERWVRVELESADQVDSLKQSVIARAEQVASLESRDGAPGAIVLDDDQWSADGASLPPRWWHADDTPDRDQVLIYYPGSGRAHDLWVFSRERRYACFRCSR